MELDWQDRVYTEDGERERETKGAQITLAEQ